MNKADLVEEISAQTGLMKRACGEAISTIIDAVTHALARGERVTEVREIMRQINEEVFDYLDSPIKVLGGKDVPIP